MEKYVSKRQTERIPKQTMNYRPIEEEWQNRGLDGEARKDTLKGIKKNKKFLEISFTVIDICLHL